MPDVLPDTQDLAAPKARAEKTVPTGGVEAHARRHATAHQEVRVISPRAAAGLPLVVRVLPVYREIFVEAIQRFRSASDKEIVPGPAVPSAAVQTAAVNSALSLSHAAEWVLDNDFLAITALSQVEQDLPSHYDLELPRLISGPLAGFPRIYALARELVLFSSARLDPEQIERFVEAYQLETPLTMGELWALPALLRFTILQALVEATARLTGIVEPLKRLPFPQLQWPSGRESVVGGAEDGGGDDAIVAASFVSLRTLAVEDWKEFFEDTSRVERLLSHDPAAIYSHMDFETRDQYRKVVEAIALRTGIEEQAVAREVLRLAQEALDRSAGRPASVSPSVGDSRPPDLAMDRRAHIGYYLLDRGRPLLNARTGYRSTGMERLVRWICDRPTAVFLSTIGGLAGILLVGVAVLILSTGGSTGELILGLFLSLIPAMTASVQWTNWLVTHIFSPGVLPKLDFSAGLPDEGAALVAIPTLLTNAEEVHAQIDQLEQHYLRNSDPQLAFALVSDFADADTEHQPGDADLVQSAVEGIEALNRKYQRPFLLLHRSRRWNPYEGRSGRWMGWERKRGKLHELNKLILATRKDFSGLQPSNQDNLPNTESNGQGKSGPAGFIFKTGDLSVLASVRYVITLDADTVLPPGEARRLVGTLAHPLNQAEFAPRPAGDGKDKVVAGYSIIQPRTKISPTSAIRSAFTRIFSGDAGLDLYTLAVSDVYQDLFGEGIYVGKGIYDVEAFERSLAGRVPENTLLSHDLFEGLFGRTALVSDSVLIEDYPSHYLVQASRMSRWIRGDWQLLPWLFPRVPGKARGLDQVSAPLNGSLRNPLSLLDRWKIVDNLRRSLLQPALMVLLAAAWLGALPSPAVWTLAALAVLALPLLTELAAALFQSVRLRKPSGIQRGARNPAFQSLRAGTLRWLLAVIFLPYEAWLALNAIAVTLVRVFITRRNLLRWTTAAQTEQRFGLGSLRSLRGNKRSEPGLDRTGVWEQMVSSPALAVLLVILVAVLHPGAAPFLILAVAWFLAPEIAHRISLPIRVQPPQLSSREQEKLRSLARRTWLFFERFVGPEDHWLPPDHFQESPLGTVAHRTSPTNIGLNLLSILGAYDLGYIGLLGLGARLRSSFDTLAGLECHRGHFLNWYDTRTLDPLQPRYVSTVDSGNLAACLIALRQGLLGLADAPVLRWETLQGLLDSLNLLEDPLHSLQDAGTSKDGVEAMSAAAAAAQVLDTLAKIRAGIGAAREAADRPQEWVVWLLEPRHPIWDELDDRLLVLVEEHSSEFDPETLHRLRLYVAQTRHRLDNAQREIEVLCPWLTILASPPELFARLGPGRQNLATAWTDICQARSAPNAKSAIDNLRTLLVEEASRPSDETTREEIRSAQAWLQELEPRIESAVLSTKALLIGFEELANQAEEIVQEMDFGFLYNPDRQVFHIGYNLALGRLDPNYYDLLASEARVASLVAIAWGQVPAAHWLHLARPITETGGFQVLLSWSATMFEYLMPRLLLRHDPETLLHASAHAATDVQIAYGVKQGTPWGISESGYYRFDPGLAYQYQAFGVPGLGYKRGLGDDLVIAPYASILALPLRPQEVVQNLVQLEKLDAMGAYGLYEALDFGALRGTGPSRLPLGSRYELVREYMAHHQGMIFLSLVNYFLDDRMVQRFHADPRIRSVELLLQEQIPQDAPIQQPHTMESGYRFAPHSKRPGEAVIISPWRVRVNAPQPRVHFLSNGRYGMLITASGGGYSVWRDLELTRWRADVTLGGWGTWIYVQDVDNGLFWSAGHEPVAAPSGGTPADGELSAGVPPGARYPGDVVFNAHTAAFARRDGDISTAMNVVVAPDADVEVRTVTLTNHSDAIRRFRLTSYAEVVLAPSNSDRRHPAFSKLFVESEYVPAANTLLFRRRPRSESEAGALGRTYLAHCLVQSEAEEGAPAAGAPSSVYFETDRARFLGRGRTARAPQALDPSFKQSGAATTAALSATLDPVMALGQEITLPPHSSLQVAFLTLIAPTRQAALALAEQYRSWNIIERTFAQARAAAEVELLRLGLQATAVRPQRALPSIQHLLSALLYPHVALRAPVETLRANHKGQPSLWPYAISGDYPILLVRLNSTDELALLQDLLQAHAYWRNRNLKIDLVIINEQGQSYGQELTSQIHRLLSHVGGDTWLNRRGGIFLVLADQLNPEDRILLEAVARVVLDGSKGSLAEQLPGGERSPVRLPAFVPSLSEADAAQPDDISPPPPQVEGLRFSNGWGGFSAPDGREYVMYLEPGRPTPAPWINVITNAEFGCLVSEAGLGYTWSQNSGENRLTPWSNDPVSDPPGEAVYLRDEETASVWSPTPQPAPAPALYEVRHGAGYTLFAHQSHGLNQQLRVFVAPDAPIKLVHLRVENEWSRVRRITVTYYAEWVLGVNREDSQTTIIPEYDGDSQALLATNPYNVEFGGRVAFAAASKNLHGLTADRTEFLGRSGTRSRPAALGRIGLASMVQPGIDPCAALQVHLDLQPGEAQEVTFFLGQGGDRTEALQLLQRFRDPGELSTAWEAMIAHWEQLLTSVQVSTPDPALDLLLNRWLITQALAGRLWGRSAFYQSSGAYGFRDQLQDVMALVYAAPDLARQHLIRAAGHQFEAGDVLHWWHPPSGRGVRTRFSDDLLWLPYVTAFYVRTKGDEAVLDEIMPFLTGPQLEPGQDEHYGLYTHAPGPGATLYEHCLRAIEKGSTSGDHGLPLMGSGDWNDGMNRVGIEGRGESVWLAWFLITILQDFAALCMRRGEAEQAERLRSRAAKYVQAIEATAWDGSWYLRAFYDDGTPLGSSSNRECQIDAIAQSWAVLSKAGDPRRAQQAMEAVWERLVRPQDRLILLFTPPFDKTLRDPGYIKGYVPGVRENGGQYTHAAIWTAWAYARLGQGDRSGELFCLLNPIEHADSPEKAARYKVEPYVIAADVYSVPPHTGRGGWTWYTGSAAWMYRLGLEAILGLNLEGDTLCLDPCIPPNWPGFQIQFRHAGSVYRIDVQNPRGVCRGVQRVTVDGAPVQDGKIQLSDGGSEHTVIVELGEHTRD